jgi:hypothetical protein
MGKNWRQALEENVCHSLNSQLPSAQPTAEGRHVQDMAHESNNHHLLQTYNPDSISRPHLIHVTSDAHVIKHLGLVFCGNAGLKKWHLLEVTEANTFIIYCDMYKRRFYMQQHESA